MPTAMLYRTGTGSRITGSWNEDVQRWRRLFRLQLPISLVLLLLLLQRLLIVIRIFSAASMQIRNSIIINIDMRLTQGAQPGVVGRAVTTTSPYRIYSSRLGWHWRWILILLNTISLILANAYCYNIIIWLRGAEFEVSNSLQWALLLILKVKFMTWFKQILKSFARSNKHEKAKGQG